jgi:hypothetical protein
MREQPAIRRGTGRLGAIAGLVLVAAVAGVSAPLPLGPLLPGSGAVRGWAIIGGTDRGSRTDDGLYPIYDGAVPAMRAAKLAAARQRIYKSGSRRLSMDLLEYQNAAAAKAAYAKVRGSLQQLPTFRKTSHVKTEACTASQAGTASGAGYAGKYVFRVSMQGDSTADLVTIGSFLAFSARKIAAAGAAK